MTFRLSKAQRIASMGAVLFGLLVITSAFRNHASEYATQTLAGFSADAALFAAAASQLTERVASMQSTVPQSRVEAIEALRNCRLRYKRIETLMEYYFTYPVNLYNRAPIYEVEEPYMEYQSPVGLQYVESLLLDPDPFSRQKEILDQCRLIAATARDIPATLYGLQVTEGGVLEACRLELIRISTLSITGYDAPHLKSGLAESAVALETMRDLLQPLLMAHEGPESDAIRRYLNDAVALLQANPGFDTFNRLLFFTKAMLPLQESLSTFSSGTGLDVNTHPAINHRARHLFSPDALNLAAIHPTGSDLPEPQLAALGKALFSEKALSRTRSRSCASCHQPDKAFTDGLVKSKSLDGKTVVRRNTPSLYYAAYQHAQFYDGRVASLEAQIPVVLHSPLEMDANLDTVLQRLNALPEYQLAFRNLWPAEPVATLPHLAAALAAYEKTLAPFRSPFDQYINGNHNALNVAQQRGFNLFMGKAQCGTCHFAPLFNGLLPPYYERSEVEIIGVPQRDSRGRQKADSDSGRYGFFPISFNNGAFKTTSVRNAGRTAPYMHNGVFKTLRDVIDFYNKGGGRGLGLAVPGQTLSDRPIHLTQTETADLVAFLQSLNDAVVQ